MPGGYQAASYHQLGAVEILVDRVVQFDREPVACQSAVSEEDVEPQWDLDSLASLGEGVVAGVFGEDFPAAPRAFVALLFAHRYIVEKKPPPQKRRGLFQRILLSRDDDVGVANFWSCI